VVGTTFDGPLYAVVGSDLVRSSRPILTKIFRGIHISLSILCAKFGAQKCIPRHINPRTLIFAASNVTIVMRNPANPDQKNPANYDVTPSDIYFNLLEFWTPRHCERSGAFSTSLKNVKKSIFR
jgi:hypothetical protein